jgi:hypothetical protein
MPISLTGSLNLSGSNTLIGTKTITGSVFISGSKTIIGTTSITGSLLVTGSLNTVGTITATTLVVQTITSSISSITGSTNFGSLSSNTHVFTGSLNISGSSTLVGSISAAQIFVNTASIAGFNSPSLIIKAQSGVSVPLQAIADSSGRLIRFYNPDYNNSSVGTDVRMGFGAGSGDTNFNIQVYNAGETTGGVLALQPSYGNVGIGTSSPGTKLDVTGAVRASTYLEAYDGTRDIYMNVGADFGLGSLPAIQVASNHGLQFATNNGLKMYITAGGLVGIGTGTTSLVAQFESLASSTGICAVQGRNPNSTTAPIFQASSVTAGSTNWYAFVAQSGNGSSVTANTCFIYGNGNLVNTNNSYGTLSDIKLKENIVDATSKLDHIMQLKVRNFNLKADESKTKQIGFIAQEFEQVFPGLIEESPDRDMENNDLGTVTKTIKTTVLIPILVKAIQELTARVQYLENK